MTTRTSAGIYLQVLEPAAAVATGIEIDVYDAANYARMLDTLEAARVVTLQKQLSQAGAGSFKINRHDAKATTQNLQKGNLCKVKIDGTYRGAFFAEETVRNFADISGAGAEDVEIKGRGVMSYLERAVVYPTGWPGYKLPDVTYTGVTRGAILKDQIDQAKARGALGAMTYDFSGTVDSIGNPWTDTNTLTLHIGLNLFSLAQQMALLGTDFYMDPWLCLHAYQSLSIDRTGASGADAVVLRQGKHIGQKALSMDEHNSAVRSRLLVEGSGNNIQEVVDAPIEGDTTVGRREGYLSYTSSGDTQALNDAGEALLQQMVADAQPLSMTVTHGLSSLGLGDYEPFVDYDVGDYTLVDVPGAYDLAPLRLVAVTIEQIDGGDFTVTGDFNSVYLEALIRIGQKTSGLTGGSSSSGSAPAGGGGAAGAGAGRAAAAVGDAPGYLYDKITAGAGIVKTLTGSAPAETVTLAAAGGLPPGGAAGQGLTKIDGADFHTQWVTPSGGAGGGYSPADTPPGSPNASDDEFNTIQSGLPTGWTQLQTPTAQDVNTAVAGHYYVKKTATSASTGQVGIYKAWSPSAGGMVTCKITDAVMSAVNYQRAAQLWVSAGAPGASEVLHVVQDGAGPRLVVNTYSAPGVNTGPAVASIGAAFGFQFPIYFRVVYHSATSIDWLWSKTGLLWTPIARAHNPGFAVGRVGIGIDTQQTTTDGEALFDWIRFA